MSTNAHTLTAYDRGEILEPHLHPGHTGRVDFDNEESGTELTLRVLPSPEGERCVIEVQGVDPQDVAITFENGVTVMFDAAGTPVHPAAEARDLTVRARAITRPAGDPLVSIVHLSGEDYESAVDAANDQGGSTSAVVEYLSRWDHGDETDTAAETNGHTELSALESWNHQLHEVDYGGLHYWLVIDHGLRFYALYRRPLGS